MGNTHKRLGGDVQEEGRLRPGPQDGPCCQARLSPLHGAAGPVRAGLSLRAHAQGNENCWCHDHRGRLHVILVAEVEVWVNVVGLSSDECCNGVLLVCR